MDRELSTDPRLCDMFPQARAEPTNDVSALVPPARGQQGVNEIIPARLTTKTEKRGETDAIRTPRRLDRVPPDTFSFAPGGGRSCWVLPSLQPGEKPSKTVR